MESGRDPSDARRTPGAAGAILVLPDGRRPASRDPVAAWVSAAGWASGLRTAARRRLDRARPTAPIEPDELRRRASAATLASAAGRALAAPGPRGREDRGEGRARVAAGARVPRRPGGPVARPRRRVRVAAARALPHRRPAARAARSACRRWCSSRRRSCGRRGSGACGARDGAGGSSAPASARRCARADVVACGSEAVAEQVRRIGVDDRRIVITPTGADLELFRVASRPRRRAPPARARRPVRRRLGRELPPVPRARAGGRRARRASTARRCCSSATARSAPRVEQLARERGVALALHRHRPARRHSRVPRGDGRRRSCSRRATRPFHYSPLKLAEYLAAGRRRGRAACRRAAGAAPRRRRRACS